MKLLTILIKLTIFDYLINNCDIIMCKSILHKGVKICNIIILGKLFILIEGVFKVASANLILQIILDLLPKLVLVVVLIIFDYILLRLVNPVDSLLHLII